MTSLNRFTCNICAIGLLFLIALPCFGQNAAESQVIKQLELAAELFDSSDFEKAQPLLEKYFPQYQNQFMGKYLDRDFRFYRNYFLSTYQTGNYLAALEMVDPMLAAARNSSFGTDSTIVYMKLYVAECHTGMSAHEDAFNELKSIDAIIAKSKDFPLALHSTIERNKCECLLELDRTSDAIVACNNAIELLEGVEGELKLKEKNYIVLSRIYQHNGEYKRAIQLAKRAVEWYEKESPESFLDISKFYNTLGINHFYIQEYDYAIVYFKEAIRLRKEVYGADHINLSGLYNNIGVCFMKVGDFELAEEYYTRALEIRRRTSEGKETLGIASTIFNIGMSYFDRLDYKGAIPHIEHSRRIRARELGEDHANVAHCDLIIGSSRFNLGQAEKAIPYLKNAAEVFERSRGLSFPETSRALRGLAGAYAMAGDCDSSQHYFSKFYESVGYDPADPYNFDEVSILLLLSDGFSVEMESIRDYCSSGEGAIDTLINRNLTLIDYSRSTFKEVGSEKVFFARALKVYDNILETYSAQLEKEYDSGLMASGFEIAEKEKSTYLLKASSVAEAQQLVGIPNDLFDKEEAIKKVLTEIENEQYLESQKGDQADPVKLDSLKEAFFVEKRNYRNLLDQIEEDYPDYYQLRFETEVAQLEEVQEQLLREGQVMLEYVVGYDKIHLFRIERDAASLISIENDFPLEEWIAQFRDALVAKDEGLDAYLDLGYKLYEKLLAPAGLVSGQELMIIPDGILGYLPFELLLSESVDPATFGGYQSLPYLLTAHPIHYTFSATVTLQHQEKQRARGWRGVLAFVPEFSGGPVADASLRDGGDTLRSQLQPLTGALREAEMIQRLLGGKIVKDAAATERTFVEEGGNYSVLHFATHAIVDNKYPTFSKLYFSQVPDTTFDGTLLASELYNMRLNADLVTLSACNTGFGKLEQAEGVVSLGRAFAYAGSPNLVASLWPVEDQATAKLMELFYQNLKSGMGKARALHEAKVAYLADANNLVAHPYYWGGFVYTGDERPLVVARPWYKQWGLWGVLLVGIGFLFWSRKTSN